MTTLLWFRRDLRLADNPALDAAVAIGRPVIPVYICDDADAGAWSPGDASRWWLQGSLSALSSAIEARGNRLILKNGPAESVINELLSETGVTSVYWNRRYEPWATRRDEKIKTALKGKGIEARSFNAGLLREPWAVTTQKGKPYKVFTPFWKALRASGEPDQLKPAPQRIPAPNDFAESDGYINRNYVMDPTEWCAVFKVPGDEDQGIWRTLFPTHGHEKDEDLLSDAGVTQRIKGLRPAMDHNDILHRNLYAVNQRVADRFAIGRIFLAGDAAHLNNPLGGLGLNTGIHDCMNITKKIGDVWFGRAEDDVFERYHRQRHQLATEFLQSVTIENKKRIEEKDPEVIKANQKVLRENSEDPAKAKTWLMRSSLLDSVRKEETIE